jgi:hypothetical protein
VGVVYKNCNFHQIDLGEFCHKYMAHLYRARREDKDDTQLYDILEDFGKFEMGP